MVIKFFRIFLLVLIILGLGALATQKIWVPKLVDKIIISEGLPTASVIENMEIETPRFVDGKYCFSRTQVATESEPYAVEEYVTIQLSGSSVTGEKSGTQNGPDMTNGYSGTLEGTRKGDTLEVVYAYTIEDSAQKELEIYELFNTSLLKMRWTLVEENGVLVPNKTGAPKMITYDKVACSEL